MTDRSSLSRAAVLDQLRSAFCKVSGEDPPGVPIEEATRLRDDLGLDSFAALELIFELEDLIDVRVSKSAAVSFQTVGDVVSFIVAELSRPLAPPASIAEGMGGP